MNTLTQQAWPTGGTPLVKEVQSPYFLPVTDEIPAEIVRQIVETLDPEQIILFDSYAYGRPHGDGDVGLCVIRDSQLSAGSSRRDAAKDSRFGDAKRSLSANRCDRTG